MLLAQAALYTSYCYTYKNVTAWISKIDIGIQISTIQSKCLDFFSSFATKYKIIIPQQTTLCSVSTSGSHVQDTHSPFLFNSLSRDSTFPEATQYILPYFFLYFWISTPGLKGLKSASKNPHESLVHYSMFSFHVLTKLSPQSHLSTLNRLDFVLCVILSTHSNFPLLLLLQCLFTSTSMLGIN